MKKKYLLLVIMFLNAFCLVIFGNLRTKEVAYFKGYKKIKGKYVEGAIFQVRKPQAFYYFTGYKTIEKEEK